MDILEQAQQKARKMLKGLEHLLNGERPRELGWFGLEYEDSGGCHLCVQITSGEEPGSSRWGSATEQEAMGPC